MFEPQFNIVDPNSQISLKDLFSLFYFAVSDKHLRLPTTRIIHIFYQKTIFDTEELLAPSMIFTYLIRCLPPVHPCYINEIITHTSISKKLLEVTHSVF
jgi:hypothetical protein